LHHGLLGQRRVFTVDLSKYEYTAPKVSAQLDHYTIYVYTPEMISAEKLRAICQQMPEYSPMRHPGSPRARDFYDLGGHLKSGHMRSLQNRPYGLA
jgi:hypothetical protein